MSVATIEFTATSLAPTETNSPALDQVKLTNVNTMVWLFDASTQEYLTGSFEVPPNITTGTASIRVHGYSVTAAASKNVAFDFDHAAVANDEDIDSASFTTEASGDKATINNQNDLETHEWTETVTTLGWVAGDVVFFRISRKAAGANNLSGYWAMRSLVIEIPVT